MRRPTFARLTSSVRRNKHTDSGTALRGGETVPVRAEKAAPTPRRPSRRGDPAPSWHELVTPGPKGSQTRREERLKRAAERRGEFRYVVSKPTQALKDQTPNGAPRRDIRAYSQAVGLRDAGRLVLHSRKPARPAGVALASPTSTRGASQRAALGIQTPAAPDTARPTSSRARAAIPAAQQVKPRTT